VPWQDTNISEVHAASIFKHKLTSDFSSDLWNNGILAQHYTVSWPRTQIFTAVKTSNLTTHTVLTEINSLCQYICGKNYCLFTVDYNSVTTRIQAFCKNFDMLRSWILPCSWNTTTDLW
jgi:hypothetical protein